VRQVALGRAGSIGSTASRAQVFGMAAGFLVDVAGARDLLTIGEALVSDKYGADTCAPGGRRSRLQCMRDSRSQ
jgi:hypothetical protein